MLDEFRELTPEDLEGKRRKLISMKNRIAALEDALAIHSDSCHPLLEQDLKPKEQHVLTNEKLDVVLSAVRTSSSTLFVGNGKETRFFNSFSAEVRFHLVLLNSSGADEASAWPMACKLLPVYVEQHS